jgi:hypothetical protein
MMGMGVRTTRAFQRNDVVALYSGDLYTSLTEYQRRDQFYVDQGIEGGYQFKFQYMGKTHWYENWFENYIPCFSGYGNNVKYWYQDVAPPRIRHLFLFFYLISGLTEPTKNIIQDIL